LQERRYYELKEKLSFSVENVEVLKEDPNSNFAQVQLDFFASGENLHEMYVSEETLLRTADTIKNCPVVWKYDPNLDDVYTHDDEEVPCGFVPEKFEVRSRKLDDGRTMLSIVSYIWKKYTGDLLHFFKRDGGKKPVSVEMSVFESSKLANGLTELLDFKYEGITLLGSFVTPAIPMANAKVLSFSEIKKEYANDIKSEFYYSAIDMAIPKDVKDAAQKGLQIRKELGKGGTSVSLDFARYLIGNNTITPEKASSLNSHLIKHYESFSKSAPNSSESVDWLLCGGNFAKEWVTTLVAQLKEAEEAVWAAKNSKEGEMSMEKTLKMAEEMAVEEPKKEEEMAAEEPKKEEEMAAETPAEEKKEEMAADEPEAEDNPAEEKKEEKKFEFPKNFNAELMAEMFAGDDSEEVKMASEEMCKDFADPGVMMAGMFAAMCKMAAEKKVYMAENEELKKFKADFEAQQKGFAVDKTLKELGEKVYITDEARQEMIAEADKYSLENIDQWKTFCKAKSFDFAVRESSKVDVVRVGQPFTASTPKKSDDLWG
jgi:hypothetical protein